MTLKELMGSLKDRVRTSIRFIKKNIFRDEIHGRGSVRCWIEEDQPDGSVKKWLHHEEHNLIVNTGREAVTHLLAEGDGVNYKITDFELGDPVSPTAPAPGDTALEQSAFSELITEVPVYTPVGVESTVTFTIIMEKAEGNGGGQVDYTEAGLFNANGNLFARQTFPAVVKTATRKITFEWQLIF
jgi:hypothetical protein